MAQGNMSFQEQMLNLSQEIEQTENLDTNTIENAAQERNVEEAKKKKTLLDLLVEKGNITLEMVNQWKQMYGNKIFVTMFDEDEYYVYRYCARPEWKQIIKSMPKNGTDEILDELLFNKCILYPQVTDDLKATVGAGTIGTLSLQIKVASNFIPEAVAIEMIQKL